jgi:hypothetical protein
MLASLTSKQAQFFRKIADFIATNGISPTIREAQQLGKFASTRSAVQYLEALEAAGFIERGEGARNLRLLIDPDTVRMPAKKTTSGRKSSGGSAALGLPNTLLLVTGTDLHNWAGRLTAQSMLPRIVRRLVHATADHPSRVSFGADEAVVLGGWDGTTVVDKKTAFVPAGVAGWELGTSSDVQRKAEKDYQKRTANPGDLDISDSTFVFVTARRWPSKDKWAKERRKEGRWRDVRVYDADDLEAWLELAPGVHIWLSALIGKKPEGAIDLSSFSDAWAGATRPELAPEILLAGRELAVKEIHGWLSSGTAPLVVQAETRDEAVAVFAAALRQMPDSERHDFEYRAVVASTTGAWQQLSSGQEPMILIPLFDNRAAVTNAARNGHRIVVPLARGDTPSQKALVVGPIQRKAAEEALVKALRALEQQDKAGDGSGREGREIERRAHDLASLARRSVTAFRRHIAEIPELQQPAWAKPLAGRVLLAAMLAGRWDETKEADRAAVSTLATMSFEGLTEHLVRWSHEADAPVRHIGTLWFIISKEDSWPLLYRYLTREDLQRFSEVAIEVLGSRDPRYDLPLEKQWMANVIGQSPRYSYSLHEGIANTLALMGAEGEKTFATAGVSALAVARSAVRQVLEKANQDERLWATLSSVLSLLAEAAPDQFLDAVDAGVSGSTPILGGIFKDSADSSFMSTSPHTGLLWALERLAWSPEYLSRAAVGLARLAMIDQGGTLNNRPSESLRQVFLPWHPQTHARLDARLRVIDTLRQRTQAAAWRLMLGLLPQHHDMSMDHPPAEWRPWGHEQPAVTHAEYGRGVHELVLRMLQDVGTDGQRWSDLIDSLSRLSQDDEAAVLDALAKLDPNVLPSGSRTEIWHALRKLISFHRSHADATWVLRSDPLDRLAQIHARFSPDTAVERFGWLFGLRPELLDGREPDWDAHDKLVQQLRVDAVKEVYGSGRLEDVMELAAKVEQPNQVGIALSSVDGVEGVVENVFTRYLASPTTFERGFGRGFAWACVNRRGREWAENLVVRQGSTWRSEQRAEILVCIPSDDQLFKMVDAEDEATQAAYWRRIYAFAIPESHMEYGVRNLLRHGRPYAAADYLAGRFQLNKKNPPPSALIACVLDAVVGATPTDIDPIDQSLGYHLGELLGALAENPGEVDRSRIAAIEWALVRALHHHHRPRLLHEELARNPSFFVELVSIVYRGKDEEPRDLPPGEEVKARVAHDVLDSWHTVPGRDGDTVSQAHLESWVHDARALLAERKRERIGDVMIGHVLAGAPVGEDGAWPHEAVRYVIEEIESSDMERGVCSQVYNSRGVVSKNLDEGGAQERKLVEQYDGWSAAVKDRWRRTAAMLRSIADFYRHDATRSDTDVELRDYLEW